MATCYNSSNICFKYYTGPNFPTGELESGKVIIMTMGLFSEMICFISPGPKNKSHGWFSGGSSAKCSGHKSTQEGCRGGKGEKGWCSGGWFTPPGLDLDKHCPVHNTLRYLLILLSHCFLT